MGFTPSILKNPMTERCSFWCILQKGPPYLHYYCAVMSHSCIALPPVGHFSNHEYRCCQLTGRSSCVSNFYRIFKVFIWFSLVNTDSKARDATTEFHEFPPDKNRTMHRCRSSNILSRNCPLSGASTARD